MTPTPIQRSDYRDYKFACDDCNAGFTTHILRNAEDAVRNHKRYNPTHTPFITVNLDDVE
jgi:hypothetical protein